MTDRFCGFVVSLERDLRDDDAAAVIAAIQMIKGVIDVKPVLGGAEEQIAEDRIRQDLSGQLLDVVRNYRPKRGFYRDSNQ